MDQGATLAFRNYSMAGLAKFLSSQPSLDHPISDVTGLQGNFDFDLSSMFADLDRQVGLKVEARKAAADFLIVDHVEKPAANY